MFMINSKVDLLVAIPITKELTIFPRDKGFTFRWLDFPNTQWEITNASPALCAEIQRHRNEVSMYQREPFTAGSSTHQWLWHYEEAIPSQIRIVTSRSEKAFDQRESLGLLPQHYGQCAMQGYINEQLKKMQSQYLVLDKISVFVGTWNCAGTGPRDSLVNWLRCEKNETEDSNGYDIIVISLQEICELTTMNILGKESSQELWLDFVKNQIRRAFPDRYYESVRDMQIMMQHLVGIMSVVLINTRVAQNLRNPNGLIVKLGLGGYTGNKGAICIRFDYFDTSVCVVNCHLAAHKSKINNRNEHVRSILKQTLFNVNGKDLKIYEHDLVFWTGDLNYRIQGLDYSLIQENLLKKEYSTLLKYDQLSFERSKGKILFYFREAAISFPPTYKYKAESSEYS